jgi:long-chain acyl-CoA synthetase
MDTNRIWRKSYDPGLADLDPLNGNRAFPLACTRTFRDFPEKTALAFMGVHISFSRLDRYANRFANMLLSHGFQKGDVVGINLPNIPEYVIAWLGALRAGCIVTGVSPLLSTDEMAYQLKDCNARGLVTLDAIFAGRLVKIIDDLPDLRLVVAASVGGFLPVVKRFLGTLLKKIPKGAVTPLEGRTVFRFQDVIAFGRFSEGAPGVSLTPDDIAYIQYTGGTTGDPKGAMLSTPELRCRPPHLPEMARVEAWQQHRAVRVPLFPHRGPLHQCELHLPRVDPGPHTESQGHGAHLCRTEEIPAYGHGQRALPLRAPHGEPQVQYAGSFESPDLHLCGGTFPGRCPASVRGHHRPGEDRRGYGMTETSPLTVVNPVKEERSWEP